MKTETENLLDEKRKRFRRNLFLAGAFLLPFLWILILRLLTLDNGEHSLDVFYHIRISEQGPAVFLAREFPALQNSIWRDAFADKELLFHGFLWIATGVRKLFSGELLPPFHWEYACLLAGLCGSFLFAARRMGVRARMIFAGALLMPLLTYNTVFRLTMIRPHVLSLALLFVLFGIMTVSSDKKRTWLVFALSFVYAWTYSNPHFIAIPVLIFAIFECRSKHWKAFLPLLAAVCGVILGLLIHPQAPNTWLIWKVQSIDALLNPVLAESDPNRIPAELLGASGRDFVTSIPLYLLAFLNLILIVRLWEFRGRSALSVSACAAAVYGLLFTAASLWMKRAIELGSPFTVLGFLALADQMLRGDQPCPTLKKHWKAAAWCLLGISLVTASVSSGMYYKLVHNREFKVKPTLQKYLAEQFRPGESVLNPDWSDFPQLYFMAPQLRWQWGMDPAFSMAKNPRKTKLFTATVSAKRLAAETGLRRAVLLHPRRQRAQFMEICGWNVIAEIPGEGWVFSANENVPAADGGPQNMQGVQNGN